jgi:hypothetical protein
MIVLDEQLNDERLIADLQHWYKGKVNVVQELRPHTLIPDDDIPKLLREAKDPTFVTINYADFWKGVRPERAFCIICLRLTLDRKYEVPDIVRALLSLPEFDTKQKRMGTILSWQDSGRIQRKTI